MRNYKAFYIKSKNRFQFVKLAEGCCKYRKYIDNEKSHICDKWVYANIEKLNEWEEKGVKYLLSDISKELERLTAFLINDK